MPWQAQAKWFWGPHIALSWAFPTPASGQSLSLRKEALLSDGKHVGAGMGSGGMGQGKVLANACPPTHTPRAPARHPRPCCVGHCSPVEQPRERKKSAQTKNLPLKVWSQPSKGNSWWLQGSLRYFSSVQSNFFICFLLGWNIHSAPPTNLSAFGSILPRLTLWFF